MFIRTGPGVLPHSFVEGFPHHSLYHKSQKVLFSDLSQSICMVTTYEALHIVPSRDTHVPHNGTRKESNLQGITILMITVELKGR